MQKQIITSPAIGGTYSTTTAHGTVAGGFVFVTGQVGNKPGSDPLAEAEKADEMGSIEEQAVQVCENVKAVLEEAGTTFDHVVKRNVYLTHLGDYRPIYKVLERYFPSKCASTGVVSGLIPASARLELDVIAILPE